MYSLLVDSGVKISGGKQEAVTSSLCSFILEGRKRKWDSLWYLIHIEEFNIRGEASNKSSLKGQFTQSANPVVKFLSPQTFLEQISL